LKPPSFGSWARVGSLTSAPVRRHKCPYPLRLEFRSNTLSPEASKLKISIVSREKNSMHFSRLPVHVAVMIVIIITQSDMFVQHKAVPCISLMLDNNTTK